MIAEHYPDSTYLSKEICDSWIERCSKLHQNTLLIKDFLGHSSLDSTAIYAHADSDAMAEALRSVDQEALPVKDDEGSIVFTPEKKWKGK